MNLMGTVVSFLVWSFFQSLIPTCLIFLLKWAGILQIAWYWAALPTASALFFFGSFLLATAIVRTAQATSQGQS